MAAQPKRKHSTYRKGKRVRTKRRSLQAVVTCTHCQEKKLPHHLCTHCGK